MDARELIDDASNPTKWFKSADDLRTDAKVLWSESFDIIDGILAEGPNKREISDFHARRIGSSRPARSSFQLWRWKTL